MTTARLAAILASLLLASAAWSQDAEPVDTPVPSQRNVILIIGDGMDDQQITIARNYLQGASGRLVLDDLPMRGAMQILTIEDKVDGQPVYVADSANTATSIKINIKDMQKIAVGVRLRTRSRMGLEICGFCFCFILDVVCVG